jgi:MerR family transcriptional regulator, heat shock protein HspR
MSDVDKNQQPDDDAGVYVISVAAEISGMHPQTLRHYDKLGLVSPSRTEGRNRRYSLRDIALLAHSPKTGGRRHQPCRYQAHYRTGICDG